MSHVISSDLQILSLDALEVACGHLGLELVRNQETYRWYGEFVGDYPLPEGFEEDDLGKCAHAIRIPGDEQAYEIGVVESRTGEGYVLMWDFFSGGYGMMEKVGGEDCKDLNWEYFAAISDTTIPETWIRERIPQEDGSVDFKFTL